MPFLLRVSPTTSRNCQQQGLKLCFNKRPHVIPSGGKWEKWQQLPFQQGATVGGTFVAEESTLHSPHTQKVSGPGSLSPPCLCRCEPPCPVAFLPFLKLSSSSEHCSSPASINLSPKKTANNDVFLYGLPIAFIA